MIRIWLDLISPFRFPVVLSQTQIPVCCVGIQCEKTIIYRRGGQDTFQRLKPLKKDSSHFLIYIEDIQYLYYAILEVSEDLSIFNPYPFQPVTLEHK